MDFYINASQTLESGAQRKLQGFQNHLGGNVKYNERRYLHDSLLTKTTKYHTDILGHDFARCWRVLWVIVYSQLFVINRTKSRNTQDLLRSGFLQISKTVFSVIFFE